MKDKRILTGILAAMVGTFAVYGCSSPTSTNNTEQSGMSVEAKAAFTSMYSNEEDFKDSEEVSRSNGFETKAIDIGLDAAITTDLKTRLDNLASQLVANVEVSANIVASIGRTNFTVKTSNVITNTNSDGSTSKFMAVDFTSKTTGKTESDKLSSTIYTNGNLKLEHYLTASANAYNKTALRVANTESNQKTVVTKSTATLSNGSKIEINEVRNASNGSQGTGTISITSSGGSKTEYSFNSNVSAEGKLSVDAKNTSDNSTVKLTQKTDTTASATVTSNSGTQTSDINTDFDSETSIK